MLDYVVNWLTLIALLLLHSPLLFFRPQLNLIFEHQSFLRVQFFLQNYFIAQFLRVIKS